MTDEAALPIGANSKAELKHMIERIERVAEEKDGLASDIRGLYLEAKGKGFDVKIMRKVIARRKKDRKAREEEDSLIETYEMAMGMFDE